MINKAKLAAIVVLAVAGLAATPALAQSFNARTGTGNVLPFSYQANGAETAPHHAVGSAARRSGMNAFAMEPRAQSDVDANSPAATGGGSIGYNQGLYNY